MPPKEQSGTIAIAAGSDLRLGGWVSFDWTAENLKGNQDPRIQVTAKQGEEVVYAAADPAGARFLLGGGSSLWLQRGGSASCEAILYYWDWHPQQTFVPLAEPIYFEAAG